MNSMEHEKRGPELSAAVGTAWMIGVLSAFCVYAGLASESVSGADRNIMVALALVAGVPGCFRRGPDVPDGSAGE